MLARLIGLLRVTRLSNHGSKRKGAGQPPGDPAKDKTAPRRQASYKSRMLAAGYVKVTVWVKKENREKALEALKNLKNLPA